MSPVILVEYVIWHTSSKKVHVCSKRSCKTRCTDVVGVPASMFQIHGSDDLHQPPPLTAHPRAPQRSLCSAANILVWVSTDVSSQGNSEKMAGRHRPQVCSREDRLPRMITFPPCHCQQSSLHLSVSYASKRSLLTSRLPSASYSPPCSTSQNFSV